MFGKSLHILATGLEFCALLILMGLVGLGGIQSAAAIRRGAHEAYPNIF